MFHNTNTVLDFCTIALQGLHFDLTPLDEFKGKNKNCSSTVACSDTQYYLI